MTIGYGIDSLILVYMWHHKRSVEKAQLSGLLIFTRQNLDSGVERKDVTRDNQSLNREQNRIASHIDIAHVVCCSVDGAVNKMRMTA